MGRDLYDSYDVARKVFADGDHALGEALSQLCFQGPAEALSLTTNTQPAILITSLACLAALQEEGVKAQYAAGHSLGEYTALVAAGVLRMEDALKLVRLRAMLMEKAVPHGRGGMLAIIGLTREEAMKACAEVSSFGVAEIANFNSPEQIVVAGEIPALKVLEQIAKSMGARRTVRLSVSGPFHSSLMRSVSQALEKAFTEVQWSEPQLGLAMNASGDFVQSIAEIKANLIKQVASPVRWEDEIRKLAENGVTAFIEIGPGRVLSGLIRRTVPGVMTLNVEDRRSLESTLASLRGSR